MKIEDGRSERAGRAVGLALLVDRRALGAQTQAVLDRVPELVGEHQRHHERPELLGEVDHQPDAVVGDRVVERAVERVVGR